MKFKPLRHLLRAGICVAFISPDWTINIFPHPHEPVTHHWVNKVASGFAPVEGYPCWNPPWWLGSSAETTFISYTGFSPAPLLLLLLRSKIDWFSSMPFYIPHPLPGRGNNDQKDSKKAAAGGRGGAQGLDHSHGLSLPRLCNLIARGKICEKNLQMKDPGKSYKTVIK